MLDTEQLFDWDFLRKRAGLRLSFVAETLGLDLSKRVIVEKEDIDTVSAYKRQGYNNLEKGDLYDIPPIKKAGKRK